MGSYAGSVEKVINSCSTIPDLQMRFLNTKTFESTACLGPAGQRIWVDLIRFFGITLEFPHQQYWHNTMLQEDWRHFFQVMNSFIEHIDDYFLETSLQRLLLNVAEISGDCFCAPQSHYGSSKVNVDEVIPSCGLPNRSSLLCNRTSFARCGEGHIEYKDCV